ncbi:hypothetical protein [Nonomuraea rhizosphaerae]|uniref:hypothetical protein n=1 Tax=Nonomuraea rhizosphaerae TaxID=2665663 RepID=UPI001C5F7268|nr:hypothetical protein [Nonomuraea rhizosphaerae]
MPPPEQTWPPHQQQQQAGEPPGTRRLPYTPDMLPDVTQYEAPPPKSGWRWAIVVGGIAILVAAAAIAVILWGNSNAEKPAPTPTASQGAAKGAAKVNDAKAGLSYAIPKGWKKADRPEFTSGLTSGGTVVYAFTQAQDAAGGTSTSEQLQAKADAVGLETARRLMPDLGSRDQLRTRAVSVGGQPGATASFHVVFKSATKDPAYVRIVAVQTAGGVSYVYGSTTPDGEEARQALDKVLDSVTPA